MAPRMKYREPWVATVEIPYADIMTPDELGLTDMLRYDGAVQESKIVDNCVDISGTKPMGPTQARWESFGMRVIKIQFPRLPDFPTFPNWQSQTCALPDPAPPCDHCEFPDAHERIDYDPTQ